MKLISYLVIWWSVEVLSVEAHAMDCNYVSGGMLEYACKQLFTENAIVPPTFLDRCHKPVNEVAGSLLILCNGPHCPP